MTINGDRTEIGHYSVISLAGVGRVTEVYIGRDHYDNDLAIKIIKPEHLENLHLIKGFHRCGLKMKKLIHPNIIECYDSDHIAHEMYYIAMEYVDGITLKYFIEKKSRIDVRQALSIAYSIAEALDYAHNEGIIHGELCPRNIMINRKGKVKVGDFGIARVVSETVTSCQLDSAEYMSMERVGDKPMSKEDDIFSLGIIIFEMLTGRHPYNAKTPMTIWADHYIQKNLPKLSEYIEDIDDHVDVIFRRCCKQDGVDPYESIRELKSDLLRAMMQDKQEKA